MALESEYYFITDHARDEMQRRFIAEDEVFAVLRDPDQILNVRSGRFVYQSIRPSESPSKPYLLRIFVDEKADRREVITVYRTSKVDKYWRK